MTLRALLVLALVGCAGPPDIVATERPEPGTSYDPTQPPAVLTLTGDLDVHDPALIEENGRFFLFHTGTGIASKTSDDLLTWRAGPAVFSQNPAWIADRVPDATDLWSPAVAFFGGAYHLYYAASTFGGNRSCIGHAIKSRLDGAQAFTDLGPVVCSNTGTSVDDFNAIDPEILLVGDTPWLVFGSFQSGIKLTELTPAGDSAGGALHALAARPADGDALQASALFHRAGNYYLFTSFDLCCRGVDSTHKLMVGRSAELFGPYLDRAGAALLEGGGTLILAGDDRFRGPGSNTVLVHGGRTYNVYHAYDADNAGRPTLRIAELDWDDAGWPVSGGP